MEPDVLLGMIRRGSSLGLSEILSLEVDVPENSDLPQRQLAFARRILIEDIQKTHPEIVTEQTLRKTDYKPL